MAQAKFQVLTDIELAARVENHCEEEDITASEFFKHAARNELQAWEGDQDE